MKKIVVAIILLAFSFSCSQKEQIQNQHSTDLIDLNKTEPVSVSDLFESVEVVQLETTDDCLIALIDKVIFFNNRYYVLDTRQQSVFCFDSDGKYLFKIADRGEGPEEYLYLGDFNIDPYYNQLLLVEPFGSLLSYDPDGKFIAKIRLPHEILAYNEVYPLNKDTLVFVSINKYSIVFYSRMKNEIIDKRYEIDEKVSHVSFFIPNNDVYVYNGSVFFSPPPTNNIINLADSTLYSWNFGKMNNTQKQIDEFENLIKSQDQMSTSNLQGKTRRDYISEKKLNYDIGYSYESSRYKICMLWLGQYNFQHVFLDKTTHKSFVFDKTVEGIKFLLPSFNGESIVMYYKVSNVPFLKYYDMATLSEEQQKMIKANNLEIDNPFLVKYNLKQ
jgi:hypothetical protein